MPPLTLALCHYTFLPAGYYWCGYTLAFCLPYHSIHTLTPVIVGLAGCLPTCPSPSQVHVCALPAYLITPLLGFLPGSYYLGTSPCLACLSPAHLCLPAVLPTATTCPLPPCLPTVTCVTGLPSSTTFPFCVPIACHCPPPPDSFPFLPSPCTFPTHGIDSSLALPRIPYPLVLFVGSVPLPCAPFSLRFLPLQLVAVLFLPSQELGSLLLLPHLTIPPCGSSLPILTIPPVPHNTTTLPSAPAPSYLYSCLQLPLACHTQFILPPLDSHDCLTPPFPSPPFLAHLGALPTCVLPMPYPYSLILQCIPPPPV